MIGESVGKTIYLTGLDRYDGLYLKIHTLAHSMFIFIFAFLFYITLTKKELKGRKLFIFFLWFLCILAIFNLFKSYTRNVWIGLFILWIFYLLGRKNYILLATSLISLIVVAIVSSDFHTIFFDFIEPLSGQRELNDMGAGRFGLWSYYLDKFGSFTLGVKLMGVGIGQAKVGFGISRGHNDLLSLLYTGGLIGLFLYLTLIFRIGYDIIKSFLDRQIKYLFLGFFCAVFFMNFASNGYLSRVEMGQYFYLIIGSFYVMEDSRKII
jgi:hypothetical protein